MNQRRPIGLHAALILLCLLVLLPIALTVQTSLRPQGYGLAEETPNEALSFQHYERLFTTPRFSRSLLNSTVNSVGGALLTTGACACAGYAFARLRFGGRRFLLTLLLMLLLLPGIATLIPLFKLATDLRLQDTYLIMILVYGAYGVPFGVWVMKTFYDAVPRQLEEAAAVDGANGWQTLLYVVLPISVPGLAAVFLVNFVYNWNDFLTAQMLLSSTNMKTATVTLFDLQSQLEGNNNELLAAAAVLMMLPGIVLFVLARRLFLRGMADGAVDG